jgi:four helix bundle protein
MAESVLRNKSYAFGLQSVQVGYELIEKKEFILSKQFIRSATSIGANIEEAIGSYSRKEFLHKITISYKEARETKYWIRLLKDSEWLETAKAESLLIDLEELLKMTASTIKSVKSSIN